MDKDNEDRLIGLLQNLLGMNGYADEFTGSWHRYVDAQENIAVALNNIADAIRESNEKQA